MSDQPKRKSELIKHKEIMDRADMDMDEIRRRVSRGEFPQPHSILERTWRWRREDIEPWFATGEWPATAKFKPGEGRGRVPAEVD